MSQTPPSGIQLCTQADVENSIGGAAQLAQLLDKNGDGIADSDLVIAVIARASFEVLDAIGVAYDLSSLRVPYPDLLVYTAADLGAWYSWCMGSSEIAIPEGARYLYEQKKQLLSDIAQGRRSLGVLSPLSNQLNVQQVDPNPDGSRVTRDSLKGMW